MKVGDKVRYIGGSWPELIGKVGVVVEANVPVFEDGIMHEVDFVEGTAGYTIYEYNLELIPESTSTEPEVEPQVPPIQPTFKPGARVRYNHSFSCTPTYPDLVGKEGYVTIAMVCDAELAEVCIEGQSVRVAWANLELIEEPVEMQPPIESLVKEVEPEVILEVGNLVLGDGGQLGLIDRIADDHDIIVDWECSGKLYHTRGFVECWRKNYLDSITIEPELEPQVRSEQTDGAIPLDFFEDLEPEPQRYFKSNYIDTATEIAKLVEEKQEAYGDAFGKSGQVLQILYPEGIAPEQYDDALAVVRIIDKLFRIANKKRAFGESPYRDITGYALLGVVRDEIC